MKKLNLLVTEQCNLKCSYCINKNKKNKPFDPKLLYRISPELYDLIVLCGGEPGLLNKEDLNLIKEKINYEKIKIFTNGLFLKKHGIFFQNSIFIVHLTDKNMIDVINKYNDNIQQNLIILSDINDLDILEFYAENIPFVYYGFPNNQKIFSYNFIEKFCYLNNKYNNIALNTYHNGHYKQYIEKILLKLTPKTFKTLILLNKLKNSKNTQFVCLY